MRLRTGVPSTGAQRASSSWMGTSRRKALARSGSSTSGTRRRARSCVRFRPRREGHRRRVQPRRLDARDDGQGRAAQGLGSVKRRSDQDIRVRGGARGSFLQLRMGRGSLRHAASSGTVRDRCECRADTGRVRTFPAAPYTNDVALSPDGNGSSPSGGYEGEVFHLIDVETGDGRRLYARTRGSPRSHGVPDGRHIAVPTFGDLGSVGRERTTPLRVRMLRGYTAPSPCGSGLPMPSPRMRPGERGHPALDVLGNRRESTAKVWPIVERDATEVSVLLLACRARSPALPSRPMGPGDDPLGCRLHGCHGLWDVSISGGAEVANFPGAYWYPAGFMPDGPHVTASEDGSPSACDLGPGNRADRR